MKTRKKPTPKQIAKLFYRDEQERYAILQDHFVQSALLRGLTAKDTMDVFRRLQACEARLNAYKNLMVHENTEGTQTGFPEHHHSSD